MALQHSLIGASRRYLKESLYSDTVERTKIMKFFWFFQAYLLRYRLPVGQNTCAPILRDFLPATAANASAATQNRLRINSDFAKQFNRLRPFGPPRRKFLFTKTRTRVYLSPSRLFEEGRYGPRHKREAGCDGRETCETIAGVRGRRRRVVLSPRRWGQARDKPGDGG